MYITSIAPYTDIWFVAQAPPRTDRGPGGARGAMPAKIKKPAGFTDVVKAIRRNVRQLDRTQFSSADVEIICENYGNFEDGSIQEYLS